MTISTAFKNAIFAQQSSEVLILLLTITHPDLTDDILLATDPYDVLPIAGVRGVVSRGLEFVYLPINFTLPSDDDTGAARAKLTIDNIDRRIVAAIRSVTGNLQCKMELVLASDVDAVELSFDGFELANAQYDAMTVETELFINNYEEEPFPAGRFVPSLFPGLF